MKKRSRLRSALATGGMLLFLPLLLFSWCTASSAGLLCGASRVVSSPEGSGTGGKAPRDRAVFLAPSTPPGRSGKTSPVRAAATGSVRVFSREAVVAADPTASRVGASILARGGNAVDAAVATAFALAVTFPQAGNLGGGGFMLIRLSDGTVAFVDYREKAPHRASRDMYLDERGEVIPDASTRGALAVGVPGTVAGLALAHRLYGNMPWEEVVGPAYRLARDGFVMTPGLARSIERHRELLSSHPETKRIFLEGAVAPGQLFRQPELARTLRRIMEQGEEDFYRGETARLIVEEMRTSGGLVDSTDLASYRALIRKPVEVGYRGYRIIGPPMPSSGGVIVGLLAEILEPFALGKRGYHTAQTVHLISEAEKVVFRLRALFMGDEDFYPFPWRDLLEPSYVDRLRALVRPDRLLPLSELDSLRLDPRTVVPVGSRGYESPQTTHFSVVDRWGNAVANTYTLNSAFGCGVTVKGAGFLLNNEMDDFSIKPGYPNIYGLVGSEANAIEPGKRMLSSMSPTIVLEGDRLFMVLGTPGGSTIPTTVFQVLANVVDFHMDLQEAVAAGRFHEQYLPDALYVEEGALAPAVEAELQAMGHRIVHRGPIGDVQAILVAPDGLHCVSDPRGYGEPAGD